MKARTTCRTCGAPLVFAFVWTEGNVRRRVPVSFESVRCAFPRCGHGVGTHSRGYCDALGCECYEFTQSRQFNPALMQRHECTKETD